MRIGKVAVALVLVSLPCAADEVLWDFHGIRLGNSEASVTKDFPELKCTSEKHLRRCGAYIKFSERPGLLSSDGATNVHLVFLGDRLVNISAQWMPALFEATLEKFVAAYGPPLDEKRIPIKTDDGREFENRIVIWSKGGSTLRFDRYWQNVGMSRILFMKKD